MPGIESSPTAKPVAPARLSGSVLPPDTSVAPTPTMNPHRPPMTAKITVSTSAAPTRSQKPAGTSAALATIAPGRAPGGAPGAAAGAAVAPHGAVTGAADGAACAGIRLASAVPQLGQNAADSGTGRPQRGQNIRPPRPSASKRLELGELRGRAAFVDRGARAGHPVLE